MLQNDSRTSKNNHFGLPNDLPELQNRSLNHPNTENSNPKWNQNPNFTFYTGCIYLSHFLCLTLSTFAISNKYQSVDNISSRQQNSNLTSDNTRPTTRVALHSLHFTLCTSHFLHLTQQGPAVCAKRLNNRVKTRDVPVNGDLPTFVTHAI